VRVVQEVARAEHLDAGVLGQRADRRLAARAHRRAAGQEPDRPDPEPAERAAPAERGERGDHRRLGRVDHVATEPQQATGSLSTVPPPGSFFWYLVVGASGNVAGPAGPARIGGSETARSVDPTGACASP